jgi:alkylation response protein AidB-like acyl-CoA dehydrogenase
MTTLTALDQPTGATPASASILARAAALAPVLTEHAARHDTDGTFVTESFDALRDAGLLKAGVPVELGGDGATIAELALLQRDLAHSCGSTALASSMHQHVVAFTAWRYRRGLPGAEATLRRVADDGIVLVSTGGGDYTHPSGTARKVHGGFVVSGRKRFASQSAVGAVASTMFRYDDPEQGTRVLNVAVPLAAQGVTIVNTWNSLGMRGTASDDIVFDDVFVPDDKVLANRPHGVVDGPLQVISSIAFPIVSGAYLGVADAAYEAALAAASASEAKRASVVAQRQLGLMRHKLQVAGWALDGALAAVGDDPTPDADAYFAVMAAKREVAQAGVEVCDLAMEVVGGSAYYKGSVVERCYRDIRAAKFHPLDPETTLVETGKHALALPGVLA